MASEIPSIDPLSDQPSSQRSRSLLTLGALGVVFGDIGTSPLYAFKAAFGEQLLRQTAQVSETVQADHIMGVLSLFVWSILLVICVKYVFLMMAADNEGEGGVLAMFSLLQRCAPPRDGASSVIAKVSRSGALPVLAIVGAALLYGDGMITPAISVLAAAEGIDFASGGGTPDWLAPLVAVVILVGLFGVQRFGTGRIGFLFGPIMLLWFLVLAALGVGGIIENPEVIAAVNPAWAIDLFATKPWLSFVMLGAVVLCITGCEALTIDMGHFGRTPIRLGWFAIVGPSLLLNYFGQAGVILDSTQHAKNPFYTLVPQSVLIPMIVLSIIAAVIASQAIIAGVFSVTRQAMRLVLLPSTAVRHTSKSHEGQIFLPAVNRVMFVGSVLLVLAFQTSDRLGGAYGLAVTGVMVVSTIMLAMVARRVWGWSWWAIVPALLVFVVIDFAFLGANVLKIPSGGWVPLAIGLAMIMLMLTWSRGVKLSVATQVEEGRSIKDFQANLIEQSTPRVPGGAVFLCSDRDQVPPALIKLYRHLPAVHEQLIFIHFALENRPRVPKSRRVTVEDLGDGIFRLVCSIGYLQEPYLPRLLKQAQQQGLPVKIDRVTYFIRRSIPSRVRGHHMSVWRKELFFIMLRNQSSRSDQLSLPSGQVVEVGIRLNF